MRFTISLLLLTILFLAACGEAYHTSNTPNLLLVIPPDTAKTQPFAATISKLETLSSNQDMELQLTNNLDTLSESILMNYSALVLEGRLMTHLTVQQKNAIERYVQMGGGFLILGEYLPHPYEWAWINLHSDLSTSTGLGSVIHINDNISLSTLEEKITTAIGENKRFPSKAQSLKTPDFNRFNKVVLDNDVYEPMELEVLPNGNVVFIERRGLMKLYDAELEETRVIGSFDVCTEGNYEDGLLGLALDPLFGKENFYLYLYYSPPCETPYQYLSRFTLRGDTIIQSSEKVILEVFVQREQCCHSGGSVEFGPDGLLYLSTGDNTSSKESDGFSPMDERPGRGPFDAQKSSSNTHDLRGKVLRILLEEDGTYSIPDGNLFAKDGSEGRPEIYAMGCRNPFRIAIDHKTNYLYWGDVGPDGGEDSPKYGPQSYDEWNQARKAGNFGWPYFVGDNKAYPMRDFAMDTVGKPQNPMRPVNLSPYNTGSKVLPPAELPIIWYPYGRSDEFPILGEGGRSSMAGPVYYKDVHVKNRDSKVQFPDYYNGKWFIYEWARSWIMAVSFDKAGNIRQIEPFAPNIKIEKPIDVEFGPDGAMYVLEYGRQYFLNNPDAALSRIEFANSNRAPVPSILADKRNGAAPLEVQFSAAGSFDYDLEDSVLTYEWVVSKQKFAETPNVSKAQLSAKTSPYPLQRGNLKIAEILGKRATFTFEENGIYTVQLKVMDKDGESATKETSIQVGNNNPAIALNYKGNESFFFPNTSNDYSVKISDKEDEANGGISTSNGHVSWIYLEDESYANAIESGKMSLPKGSIQHLEGSFAMRKSDCYTCHDQEKPSIIPSYRQIAQKYPFNEESVNYLATKIINGGNGVWGERLMAAHPQLSQEEAAKMARYVLSLEEKSPPLEGKISMDIPVENRQKGAFILTANYEDKGSEGFAPIGVRETLILRPPILEVEEADFYHDAMNCSFGEHRQFAMLCGVQDGGYIRFDKVDLKGIQAVNVRLRVKDDCKMNVRTDSPDGEVVGSVNLSPKSADEDWRMVRVPIGGKEGKRGLFLEFEDVGEEKTGWGLVEVDWLGFGE